MSGGRGLFPPLEQPTREPPLAPVRVTDEEQGAVVPLDDAHRAHGVRGRQPVHDEAPDPSREVLEGLQQTEMETTQHQRKRARAATTSSINAGVAAATRVRR